MQIVFCLLKKFLYNGRARFDSDIPWEWPRVCNWTIHSLEKACPPAYEIREQTFLKKVFHCFVGWNS